VVALASVLVSQQGQASIRVFGSAGLSQVTPTDGDWKLFSEDSFNGYDVRLLGQIDVLSPIPLLSIFAGPNVQFGQAVRESKKKVSVTVNGQATGEQETTVKETLDSKSAGVELGAQFSLVGIAQLQAAAHYNLDLSNGYKFEAPVSSVTANKELTLASGNALGFTVHGLLTPFPFLRAGVEYGVESGSRKYKDETSEFKFDNWSVRGMIGVSL
jgi:hypothetical protein